ncbi:MAG: AraC family transcriptional regulator [Ruminococcaceae bacterium]|nr:AraC family transcriptional regulator [Oscillospiraceae bacterium]
MKISEICEKIEAKVLCGDTDKCFEGVYVGDLLSRAMSHVCEDNIWITIMSNVNVIAVASLTEPAAVLLAESVELTEDVLAGAAENGITVLSSPLGAYELCVRLHDTLAETEI